MHRDFHYWATFMAARAAGVHADLALELAEYAELVDEAIEGKGPNKQTYIEKNNDLFHWRPQYWVKSKHVQRTASAVLSKEFVQKGKDRGPWHALTWTAFHFLPNLDPEGTSSSYYRRYEFDPELTTEYKPDYRRLSHTISKGARNRDLQFEQQLICYPGSKTAIAFVEDLKEALAADDSRKIESYISKSLHSKEINVLTHFKKLISSGPVDVSKFKTALMGVKMHVFADLWAHQGFVAARSPRANDVAGLVVGHDFNSLIPWKDDPKVPTKEKLAAGKIASHYGHGNAIRFPDQPGYVYEYVRPFDKKLIQRDNAVEFAAAYEEMYELLKIYKESLGGEREMTQYCPGEIGESYFRAMKDYDKVARNRVFQSTINRYDRHCSRFFIDTKLTGDYDVIAMMRDRGGDNLPYFALAALCHLSWTEKQVDRHFGGGSGSFHRWIGEHLMYKAKKKVSGLFTKRREPSEQKHAIPGYKAWLKLSSGHGMRASHDLTRIDLAVKDYGEASSVSKKEKVLKRMYDLCRSWLRQNEAKSRKRTEAVLFLTRKAAYFLDHPDEIDEGTGNSSAPQKKRGFLGFRRKK